MTINFCFPNGVFKALTLSYDDGRSADRKMISIMNRYGVRGTFHLNSGLLDSEDRIPPEEIPELYAGHEVAVHTKTHPTIARCPREQIVQQIMDDRRDLEDIVGYPVRGMSYPNGSYTNKIKDLLPHLGIEYSRIVGSSGTFALPEDLYAWQATCHHNRDLLQRADQFLELHKSQYLYLMYVWGHSYEFDNEGNWDLIEDFCRKTGSKNDIWYATNIEIVDYKNVLNNLRFDARCRIVCNPSAADAWLNVAGAVVRVPGGETVQL